MGVNYMLRLFFSIILFFSSNIVLANEPKDLAQKNGCFACHSVKLKVLGPSFIEISNRYIDQSDINEFLINKVVEGGSGNWGSIQMIAHPNISDKEIREIIDWILKI